MTVRYLAHCTLIPIWIRGYDRKQNKYLYTLDRKKAYRFASRDYARKAIKELGSVWAANMEVVECREVSESKTSRLIDTSRALNSVR